MKDDETLSPEETQLDGEMRALLGTDDVDVPYPAHDAWRDLGSHVRSKANAPEPAEKPLAFRLLAAAACFAVALLAIALARPQPEQPLVDTATPEVEIAESVVDDTQRELDEIDALMQQIELDELAIGLRDSGVVNEVEEAFGLLREYGIDEDGVFDDYVDSL